MATGPSERELSEALGRAVRVDRRPDIRAWRVGTQVKVGGLRRSLWVDVYDGHEWSTSGILSALRLGIADSTARLESEVLGEDTAASDARLDRALEALGENR